MWRQVVGEIRGVKGLEPLQHVFSIFVASLSMAQEIDLTAKNVFMGRSRRQDFIQNMAVIEGSVVLIAA